MNLKDFKEISDQVSSQVEEHRTEMLEMIKTYMMIHKKNNSNKIEMKLCNHSFEKNIKR